MIGAAAAVLLAAPEVVVDISDHTEGRARLTQMTPYFPEPSIYATDFLTTPRFYFEVASPTTVTWRGTLPNLVSATPHRWRYTLTLLPSFYGQDVFNYDRGIFVNAAGTLSADWRNHRTHVGMKQEGSFGSQSTAYLGLSAPVAGAGAGAPSAVTPQFIPQIQTYLNETSRTTAQVEYRFSPLLLGSVLAYYQVSGGVRPQDQTIIPLQYGPHVEVAANYTITPRDFVITTVAFTQTNVNDGPCLGDLTSSAELTETLPTCAPTSDVSLAQEEWRHRLTAYSYFDLGAGLSVINANLDLDPPVGPSSFKTVPAPVGLAIYQYSDPVKTRYPGYYETSGQSFRAQIGYTPVTDYRGLTDDQGSATIIYTYVDGGLSFAEQVVASSSTGSLFTPPTKVFSTRTSLAYQFNRHVAVDGAIVYALVQEEPYIPVNSGYFSLGLTVGTGPTRLGL
jgi:hypothetical protein